MSSHLGAATCGTKGISITGFISAWGRYCFQSVIKRWSSLDSCWCLISARIYPIGMPALGHIEVFSGKKLVILMKLKNEMSTAYSTTEEAAQVPSLRNLDYITAQAAGARNSISGVPASAGERFRTRTRC